MASTTDLARLPRELAELGLRSVAFPFAVLAELRRLNRTLGGLTGDLGPHLEYLPNPYEGIRAYFSAMYQY